MNSLSHLLFIILVCISAFAFADPVQAKGQTQASKDAVLAACRHTSGCSYDTDTNTGETAGCSPHACFHCKGSTCQQTWAGKETAGLKPKQLDPADTLEPLGQNFQHGGNPTQSQTAASLAGKAAVVSQGGFQQAIN